MNKRQAKQTPHKGKRIKLSGEDYWKFRASVNDVNAIHVEATKAAATFRQRIGAASEKTRALFAELGKAHGFDPLLHYAWNDETCELIEVQVPQ